MYNDMRERYQESSCASRELECPQKDARVEGGKTWRNCSDIYQAHAWRTARLWRSRRCCLPWTSGWGACCSRRSRSWNTLPAEHCRSCLWILHGDQVVHIPGIEKRLLTSSVVSDNVVAAASCMVALLPLRATFVVMVLSTVVATYKQGQHHQTAMTWNSSSLAIIWSSLMPNPKPTMNSSASRETDVTIASAAVVSHAANASGDQQ